MPYIVSMLMGALVGAIYGAANVRSPAPPIIALLGLLGMVMGEAGVSYLRGHPNVMRAMWHAKSFAHDDRSAPQPAKAAAPAEADRPTD